MQQGGWSHFLAAATSTGERVVQRNRLRLTAAGSVFSFHKAACVCVCVSVCVCEYIMCE